LIGILAVGFFFGFYSEGYDRLWQAHVLDNFSLPAIPWVSNLHLGMDMVIVIWYAALKIIMMMVTVIATHVVEQQMTHPKMTRLIKSMFILSFFLILCLIGFTLSGNLLSAVVFVILIGVIREVTYPVYNTWVNHRLDPQVRATVLSMSSQVDAVGQIAGGPIVGVIANSVSVTAGLLTSSAMLAPILGLLFAQRKSVEDVSLEIEGG
jgi:MFS transporter, DHA3 family, tetracycline resistance protein